MKRYNTLSEYLKIRFGGKIAKISIDAGFTCPNRINGSGCLFCTDSGGSEFSGKPYKESVTEQIDSGKQKVYAKWNPSGYIAYFQNFSNTYDKAANLEKLYEEALKCEGIVGLAIATRPDCFNDDIFGLLEKLSSKTFLWMELGLQTSNQSTARRINRGFENNYFENTVSEFQKRNIMFVTHLIAGLPGETREDFKSSVEYINKWGSWGVKFHNIYIQKNSPLYEYSIINGFKPLDMYEYIDWVTEGIVLLDKKIVIHRLTGDPDKNLLHEPDWIRHKLKVLSEIDRILIAKEGSQGSLFKNQS